jgi:hypothetical protein
MEKEILSIFYSVSDLIKSQNFYKNKTTTEDIIKTINWYNEIKCNEENYSEKMIPEYVEYIIGYCYDYGNLIEHNLTKSLYWY